jgi:hypothetical protein
MAEAKTHLLWQGRALCGLRGLPSDWPAGHKWVALDDRENIHHVSCHECMGRAHEAGVKHISPSAREARCACGAQIFIDDETCTIHHAAPVCAEFMRRAAGATRSITILDTEKRN